MSSLPPASPPEPGGIDIREAEPPPLPPAPSPENDDISPPPALDVQIPPPSFPPESSGVNIIPSPLASPPLAPPLSTSPIFSPPPPTPFPVSSPPPDLPLQPPPIEPSPITQQNPPQKKPNPPRISPPVNEPGNIVPPPTPSIKASPATPASSSSPLERPHPRPAVRRARTGPDSQPRPSQPGPSRLKNTIPSSAQPPASLPTSAVLPSPPPVALPVPQSPDGGAWLPFSSETPSPLPSFPGLPGVANSPATPLLGNPSGGSSQLVPSGGDHQNIEASAGSSGRSTGSSSFVVGLCVGGVLLLLFGAALAILVVFCRRKREKRFDDHHGSGSKYEAAFSGFEDKTSLPQYTKQSSNSPGHQVLVNVTSTQRPTITTNGSGHGGGHTMAIRSPTPGVAISFSGGTFTYEELVRATDGFSERNLLGQGGFGYVHKGVLPNGKEVAVKKLKMGGHQGEREFQAEVETISQVHHKHLVSLVGYCIAGSERLLVYEFVPNNTLEFHLHGKGQPVMDWPTRLKIAIGAAKGLAYLHEDCSPTIIHRDIKASNILLHFNFEAKVSDFGLAKIFTGNNSSVTHITTRIVGTFGYLAPEYASSGKVTDKSDVYSYGVMLLELITGRPPICNFESATNGSLVNWARPLLARAIGDGNFDNLADPQLQNNYNVDDLANMVACAAACVRLSAWRRPRMSQVVRALEGNLAVSELDDGTRPGDSSMQFPYEGLDFDAHNYMEDLKRMALTSNNGYGYATSRYSDNPSDYGLHPSDSSTETQTTSPYSGQRG